MKKLFYSIIASSFLTFGAWANTPVIIVHKVLEDITHIDVGSSQWRGTNETQIVLYPQTTITLNDKKANELNANNTAQALWVKAITDGKHIAFKLRWQDESKSVQSGNAIKNTEFPDGFAIQFAAKYDDPSKLPYIGMGSKDRPVVVYLQKAVQKLFEPNGNGDVQKQVNRANVHAFNSLINHDLEKFDIDVEQLAVRDYQKVFISEGFRSMTEIKDHSTKFNAQMQYQTKWFGQNEWEGIIVRSLNDEYIKIYNDPFPVAFAVWDGAKMGRDGLKNLSTWIIAQFEGVQGRDGLKNEFDKDLTAANIYNGEALTKANCASCHNYGNVNEAASSYMAPNLSNIGGYSTTPYLIESIIHPNAVVVSGYNRNAHANFAWYYEDGQGGRTSAMPSFEYLTQEEINDITAYLKTLKAEVK